METLPDRNPNYIDEVEALLQTNFFYDEVRASVLYEEPDAFAEEEIGSRKDLYIQTLRILAGARQDERNAARAKEPSLDSKTWNQDWRLTPKRLGALTLQHRHELVPLSRRLSLINNAEKALEDGYAQLGLYDHQIPYLRGVVENIQRKAAPVILPDWWEGERDIRLPGITVTGPTGIGKSAILARAVMALGIDKPLLSYEGERKIESPAHVLVVEPSQALIRQMLGKTGKDTFRRLAPNVSVGGYFQHEKNTGAKVRFISIPKFISDFRDGYLGETPIDAVFVDEDHHLTEEKFLTALLKNWNGPTFGFSATPTYNHGKDVRNILRYEVKEGDILDYADGEILSNLQLYNFVVLPEDIGIEHDISGLPAAERRGFRQRALTESARDFLIPLLAEGRKGIIFCEPGDESDHAQRTAELLDGLKLPDGRIVSASAIGTFQGRGDSKENEAIIKDYDDGKIDVITTTLMGQEGLDLDEVNFVCVLGKISSVLKLTQMGGRGTRPSDLFDTTVLAQFNTIGFGQIPNYAKTFAEILNGGIIDQGVVLTRDGNRGKRQGSRPSASSAFDTTKLPEHLQRMLARINKKNVQDVYIGRQEGRPVTDGYLPLESIVEGKSISAREAWSRLYRAGYRFEGRNNRTDGQNSYSYYFEPAAKTYFSQDPQPPEDGILQIKLRPWVDTSEASPTVYTLDDLADAIHVHKKVLIRDYLTPEEIAQGPEVRTSGNRRRIWPKQDGDRIIERVSKFLEFPPDRLPVVATTKRLNAKYSTVLEYVRQNRTKLGVEDVTRGKQTLPGLPWATVAKLEERYGLREGVEPIDYSRMPTSSTDDDERIRYARDIQRRYLHPSWLPPEQGQRPSAPPAQKVERVVPPPIPPIPKTSAERAPEPSDAEVPPKVVNPGAAVQNPIFLPPANTSDSASAQQPVRPPARAPQDKKTEKLTVPPKPHKKPEPRETVVGTVPPRATPPASTKRPPRPKPPAIPKVEEKPAPVPEPKPKPPSKAAPKKTLAPVTSSDPPESVTVAFSAAPIVLPPEADAEESGQGTPSATPSSVARDKQSTDDEPASSRQITREARRAMLVAARGTPSKKGKAPSSLPKAPVRSADHQRNRADMPKGYMNINEYLAGQGVTCNPSLMQELVRKLPFAIDEDGGLWGPDLTALELEEVITKRFPAAEANMRTPAKIAEEFAHLGTTTRHVAYIASSVVNSTKGHVFIRRELPEPGKPVRLDYHYGPTLTRLVTTRIKQLGVQGIRKLLSPR